MKLFKKLSVFFSLMFVCALVSCRAEFIGNMEQFAEDINQEIINSPEGAAELMETSLKRFFIGNTKIGENNFNFNKVMELLSLPRDSKIKNLGCYGSKQTEYINLKDRFSSVKEKVMFEVENNGEIFKVVICKNQGTCEANDEPEKFSRYIRYYTYKLSDFEQNVNVVNLDVLINMSDFSHYIRTLRYQTVDYNDVDSVFGGNCFNLF